MTPAGTNERAPRTTCRNGHDLTDPANVLPERRFVACRACKREQNRRADRRRRALHDVVAIAESVAELAPAVAAPVEPEDDGKRYPIEEWLRLFGRPPIAYGQVEDAR